MGIGAYIFGFIGAFFRWIFKGFKPSFKEVWDGPDFDDPADKAAYEITNNVIGVVVIIVLCTILVQIKY